MVRPPSWVGFMSMQLSLKFAWGCPACEDRDGSLSQHIFKRFAGVGYGPG